MISGRKPLRVKGIFSSGITNPTIPFEGATFPKTGNGYLKEVLSVKLIRLLEGTQNDKEDKLLPNERVLIQCYDVGGGGSLHDVSTDPTSGDAYQNYLKLDAAGVPGANSIGGVFYFANGFDTTTKGMDIVATYPLTENTNLTAAINYNKTEFDSDPSAYLNVEDQFDFENLLSDWRGIYTITHDVNIDFDRMI